MTEQHLETDYNDVAPGEEILDGSGVAQGVRGYILGFVLAAALTFASFYVHGSDLVWAPGVTSALIVLAIAQMGVHLVFFLHVSTGPDSTNNVLALAFGILIVALVIIGSLWIMANLDERIMPMEEVMKMHR